MKQDSLVQEKVAQAVGILQEQEIDCWLTFVRETRVNNDPVLPLIYGHELTWQSALMLFRSGRAVAIVGHYEMYTAENLGAYEVRGYHQSIRDELRAVLAEEDPQQIALNYSENDLVADGLSVGMFRVLKRHLEGTPFVERFCSSEGVVSALRGRKTPQEVERIRAAIRTTEEIYDATFNWVHPGLNELDVSEFMHQQVYDRHVGTAWDYSECPAVDAGPDTALGHAAPDAAIPVRRGQILHLDFGVRQNEYNPDIQRVMYFLAEDETRPPDAVRHGFDTVVRAVQAAADTMKPGVTGVEVDRAARRVITEAGYPEHLYATGHQLGRAAHGPSST